MNDLIFYIGAFDAIVISAVGLVGAFIILFGYDAEKFWNRWVPAALILIGSSFAAGVVMAVTGWLGG